MPHESIAIIRRVIEWLENVTKVCELHAMITSEAAISTKNAKI